MSNRIRVMAPAKINLYLDITGIRDDGYHLLEMVMQSVGLSDEITISRTGQPGIVIESTSDAIPIDHNNLCYRAAESFCNQYSLQPDFLIQIKKHIPPLAGLGGGSADAAAVLTGLNHLFKLDIPIPQLCELGESIGADVPFCLTGGTAEVRGIGEFVTSLPDMPDCYIVIAKPNDGVSTREAFALYDQVPEPLRGDTSGMIASIVAGEISDICQHLFNTFQALHQDDEVQAVMREFNRLGASGALMTGSGSACYGIFENKSMAKKCYRRMMDLAQSVYLTRPIGHGAVVL